MKFILNNINLCIFLILLSFINVINAFDCGKYDSHMGATFDLLDLERHDDQPAYTVEDGDLPCTTGIVEQNYTYVFNVCGTVLSSLPNACLKMSGLSTAGAIQVDKRATINDNDDFCYIVGAYSDKTSTLKLISEDDPTKGLRLTYFGDYCHNPVVQRKFHIELTCEDALNPVPRHAYETSYCEYTTTIPSVYGCPLECPVAQRKLCGGNGHCSYDTDKGAARCFCNHGYSGSDCMSNGESKNYSPALLGLIITLFIIIGILVASVVLMIRQVSAYRDDMTNYQVLKGGDDDSAVV